MQEVGHIEIKKNSLLHSFVVSIIKFTEQIFFCI